MTYRGRVIDGVIVLDAQVQLPEGARVSVEPIPEEPPATVDTDHPFLRMLELAGDTGIPDLATNIDHYLYGHPKVDDGG